MTHPIASSGRKTRTSSTPGIKQGSKDSHEVYNCPRGKHTFTLVTGHGTVLSSVVRKA